MYFSKYILLGQNDDCNNIDNGDNYGDNGSNCDYYENGDNCDNQYITTMVTIVTINILRQW